MGVFSRDISDVPRITKMRDALILGALLRRGGPYAGKRVADVGCGYHAAATRRLLDQAISLTLVDREIAPALKARTRVTAIEGGLPDTLLEIPDGSIDVVICSALLEHLDEPVHTLQHLRRIAAPGGRILIAVPSWLARPVLEFLAFRVGRSADSRDQINDHRMYYTPHELWPLLVRGGFRPSEISCRRHWMRLNTFAVCKV